MITTPPSPHNSLLSSSVRITTYRHYEDTQDREKIADFIDERFRERYITPLRIEPSMKNGFCTMAICCLMIEALESFWRGWANSNGKSEQAFCSFFDRSSSLAIFRGNVSGFYKHVRCGILHQAETTGGWHILRKGELFDITTKRINATAFHNALEKCLNEYCTALRSSEWNDDIWRNLRKKMKAVCNNCAP